MPRSTTSPTFKKLTPNLIVASVDTSLAFYTDTLGFERGMTVPDQGPFVFASATRGPVEIFFNDAEGAVKEYPVLDGRPIGATGTLFIEVEGVDALHDSLQGQVTLCMPIGTKWYGMREFAILDPDGYVITFAERVTA
jgi:catechol 2,3-dioxygenase-like lactoylglutathione lyase family enzyme